MQEQVTGDEMTMMSALYQTNMLRWIFVMLAHRKYSPRVAVIC
jgi:hypothetical protein